VTSRTNADDNWTVAETLYRYATGIDRRDWPLYRSIFAEEVLYDFSSYGANRPPRLLRSAEWVDSLIPLFTGLDATQHSMTNPTVRVDGDRVDGDRANITMYMQAHHVFDSNDPDSYYTLGGYYDDTLVRNGDGWLITGVTLTVTWQRGNYDVMEAARAKGLATLGR
jgi:SnoaL-like domain